MNQAKLAQLPRCAANERRDGTKINKTKPPEKWSRQQYCYEGQGVVFVGIDRWSAEEDAAEAAHSHHRADNQDGRKNRGHQEYRNWVGVQLRLEQAAQESHALSAYCQACALAAGYGNERGIARISFMIPSVIPVFLVAALDSGRLHWLPVPWWGCAFGYVLRPPHPAHFAAHGDKRPAPWVRVAELTIGSPTFGGVRARGGPARTCENTKARKDENTKKLKCVIFCGAGAPFPLAAESAP
jgi:hypothetical protein